MKTWSYAVTTTPNRLDTLTTTLRSLSLGGFSSPLLAVDGISPEIRQLPHLVVERGLQSSTGRHTSPTQGLETGNLLAFGNWHLTLLELTIRSPQAQFYTIFQDDLETYINLLPYLQKTIPEHRDSHKDKPGYYNLFSLPLNYYTAKEKSLSGWFPAEHPGLGALALVFPREAAIALLSSEYFLNVPTTSGWQAYCNIDGHVHRALVDKSHFTEYVHSPSLVQHIGQDNSEIRKYRHQHKRQPLAPDFRGSEFDALSLL